jgi:hypothetical protein
LSTDESAASDDPETTLNWLVASLRTLTNLHVVVVVTIS